jgi:effector-binding domain-containing protein
MNSNKCDTIVATMKITELKKKFKNKWVLAEVIKENELNQPVEVKPIMASFDKNEIYDRIAKVPKGKTVATIFTGKIKGAFLFRCQA